MVDIQVDPEFQALIPPLDAAERAGLEESLKREGCRDALVTWGGLLLDGHNRLAICRAHGSAGFSRSSAPAHPLPAQPAAMA
jgi:hypothetical protein